MEHITPALIATSGALIYSVWGYLKRRKKTETFQWNKFFLTVIPPAFAAFTAAWMGQISIGSTTDYFTLILAGFGWAKVQNKLGWK